MDAVDANDDEGEEGEVVVVVVVAKAVERSGGEVSAEPGKEEESWGWISEIRALVVSEKVRRREGAVVAERVERRERVEVREESVERRE